MNTISSSNALSKKQPKALIPLCATEMWERFGFYIIQGLLVLFLKFRFGLSDAHASLITGVYGALLYVAPLVGGYYACNYLGFRYTIVMGGCFQLIGYLLLSTLSTHMIYWGLALIILGNGFLKPNIASYLGEFYIDNDPRRHSGFTYYYMGMNLGAFISTLIAGFIQRDLGWHICFATAGLGMLIGVLVFTSRAKVFGTKGLPVAKDLIKNSRLKFITATLAVCIAITVVCYGLLTHPQIGNYILLVIAVFVLIYLVLLSLKYHGEQRRNLIALIWLILYAVIFWAFFFLMYTVINLFLKRSVDRELFGTMIPPLAFLSLEPAFILILGWPLAKLWQYLHHKTNNPNIALKFFFALLAMSMAMWLLTVAIRYHNPQLLVLPIFMVGFFLLYTLGEMLLSPNLLSAVTELSPPKVMGLMMGVQYMAIGFGNSIMGLLSQIAAIPNNMTSKVAINQIYSHAFHVYALMCLGTAIVILISV
ncbi:MAG: dipeptide/tripeptide permease, partial [Coxiella sp. (in: Bacteria)]